MSGSVLAQILSLVKFLDLELELMVEYIFQSRVDLSFFRNNGWPQKRGGRSDKVVNIESDKH